MTSIDYDKKMEELREYIPLLETLIAKLKSEGDKRLESQINKMETLHGLLTNQNKKLKPDSLQKCEAALKNICQKLANTNKSKTALTDMADVKFLHNQTDEPQKTPSTWIASEAGSNIKLLATKSGETSENTKFAPELFKRRSPNRVLSEQYYDELRRKYESMPSCGSDSNVTPQIPDYQLQSPMEANPNMPTSTSTSKTSPLSTLGDSKDVLIDSAFQRTYASLPVTTPTNASVSSFKTISEDNHLEECDVGKLYDQPIASTSTIPLIGSNLRDPRILSRLDPRLAQKVHVSGTTEAPKINFPEPTSIGVPFCGPNPTGAQFPEASNYIAYPQPEIFPAKQFGDYTWGSNEQNNPRELQMDQATFEDDNNPTCNSENQFATNCQLAMSIVQPLMQVQLKPFVNPTAVYEAVGNLFKAHESQLKYICDGIKPKRKRKRKKHNAAASGAQLKEEPVGNPFNKTVKRNKTKTKKRKVLAPRISLAQIMANRKTATGSQGVPMQKPSATETLIDQPDKKVNSSPPDITMEPKLSATQTTDNSAQNQNGTMEGHNEANHSPLDTNVKLKKIPLQASGITDLKHNVAKPMIDAAHNEPSHSSPDAKVKLKTVPAQSQSSILDIMYGNINNGKATNAGISKFKIPKIQKKTDNCLNFKSSKITKEGSSAVIQTKKSKDIKPDLCITNYKEGRKSNPNPKNSPKPNQIAEMNHNCDKEPNDVRHKADASHDINFEENEAKFAETKEQETQKAVSQQLKTESKANTVRKKIIETFADGQKNSPLADNDKEKVILTGKTEKKVEKRIEKGISLSTQNIVKKYKSKRTELETPLKVEENKKRRSDCPAKTMPNKILKIDPANELSSGKEEADGVSNEAVDQEKSNTSNLSGKLLIKELATVGVNKTTLDKSMKTESSDDHTGESGDAIQDAKCSHPPLKSNPQSTSSGSPDQNFKTVERSSNKPTANSSKDCSMSNKTTVELKSVDQTKSSKATLEKKKSIVVDAKALSPQREQIFEKHKKQTFPEHTKAGNGNSSDQQQEKLTKEWLSNMFSATKMDSSSILVILEKALDADKFQKVQKVLCPENSGSSSKEDQTGAERLPVADAKNVAIDSKKGAANDAKTQAGTSAKKKTTTATKTQDAAGAKKKVVNTKKKKQSTKNGSSMKTSKIAQKTKRKNELEMLNQDINDMFIRDGVLAACGRRNSSLPKKKKNELDKLNEDIHDMFIREGVLAACGRRSFSAKIKKKEEGDLQKSADCTLDPVEPANTSATEPSPTVPKIEAMKVKRRRESVLWLGNKRQKSIASFLEHFQSQEWQIYPDTGENVNKNQAKNVEKSRLIGKCPKKTEHSEPQQQKTLISEEYDHKPLQQEPPKMVEHDNDPPQENGQHCKEQDEMDDGEELLKIVVGHGIIGEHISGSDHLLMNTPSEDEEGKIVISANTSTTSKPLPSEAVECSNTANADCENIENMEDTRTSFTKQTDLRDLIKPCVVRLEHCDKSLSKTSPHSKSNEQQLKNINPNLHALSSLRFRCVLCDFAGMQICLHYVSSHPGSEVFIARLPPQCKDQLLAKEKNIPTKVKKKYSSRSWYSHTCPICLKPFSFRRFDWVNHFANHTGEFRFTCSKCSYATNIKLSMEQHITFQCPAGHMVVKQSQIGLPIPVYGYVCNICNYIQMDNQKVAEHLHSQHDCFERDMITEVVLLDCISAVEAGSSTPSLPSLPAQIAGTVENLPGDLEDTTNGNTNPRGTQDPATEKKNEALDYAITQPAESVDKGCIDPLMPKLSPQNENNSPFEIDQEELVASSGRESVTKEMPVISSPQIDGNHDDIVVISDDEEVKFTANEQLAQISKTESDGKQMPERANKSVEELEPCSVGSTDDDDEWVDIEISTTIGESESTKSVYSVNKCSKLIKPKLETAKNSTNELKNSSADFSKLSSNRVQRIDNIGFSQKDDDGVVYHCLFKGCSFLYSSILAGLQHHLDSEHAKMEWSGFCHICSVHIMRNKNSSLTEELHHMQDAHIDKLGESVVLFSILTDSKFDPSHETKPETECIQSAPMIPSSITDTSNSLQSPPVFSQEHKPKSTLKVRRFSGDSLSTNYSPLPPLQITRVISLNRAADICEISIQPSDTRAEVTNLPTPASNILSSRSTSTHVKPSVNDTSTALKIVNVKSIGDNRAISGAGKNLVETSNTVNTVSFLPPNSLECTLKPSSNSTSVDYEKCIAPLKARNVKSAGDSTPISFAVKNFSGTSNTVNTVSFLPSKTLEFTQKPPSNSNSIDYERCMEPLKVENIKSAGDNTAISFTGNNFARKSNTMSTAYFVPTNTLESALKLSSNSNSVDYGRHIEPLKVTSMKNVGGNPAISIAGRNVPGTSNAVSTVCLIPQVIVKSCLKPWTNSNCVKSESCIKTLFHEKSLCAFYKCMGKNCDYVTNFHREFLSHLERHLLLKDAGETWGECSYCDIKRLDTSKLVSHIAMKHDNDIYQCAYCFYRSCEGHNVVSHQKFYHDRRETKVFVLSDLKLNKKADALQFLARNAGKYVAAIRCNDCPKEFLSIAQFQSHLQEHVLGSKSVYKCFHCNSSENKVSITTVADHLAVLHGIFLFQCVYCNFGSNIRNDLERHLVDNHPSDFPFCCIRKGTSDVNSTNKISYKVMDISRPVDMKYLHCSPNSKAASNSLCSK